MIENNERNRLKISLEKWLKDKINTELDSLLKLKHLKENNSEVRALAYNLYENNGVVKREKVKAILDKLGQEERKILRNWELSLEDIIYFYINFLNLALYL